MARNKALVHFEGRLVPAAEAVVNALSPAITRGPIVYETLRGYWNEDVRELYIFRLDDHIRRLTASMKILRFQDLFEKADLSNRVLEVVRANGFKEDIHFRLFVYPIEHTQRGRATTMSGIVISAEPRPREQKRPAACQISSWCRGGDNNQPARVKAMGNRLFARAAMDQAVADGYDQLIFLNERGKVAEAVSSNIFLVRRGMVGTPETTASLLEGITRATILALLEDMGIPFVEREVDRTELYDCDEAFLCSTGIEILPLASVDRLLVNGGKEGEITAMLRRHYLAVVRGQTQDFPQWRTPVYRSGAA